MAFDRAMWEVAARYGFTEAEMWAMPMSRLRFWHEGHMEMHREEIKLMGGKPNG